MTRNAASAEVIINTGSGSYVDGETVEILTQEFKAGGIKPNFHLVKNGRELTATARQAARSDTKIIVAGGGDGTISAVAAEVAGTGKVLGILPLGTLNNFSKDLEIPQELAEAARLITVQHTTTIDLAEVNGRIFINNSSIGLYPRIVRKRDQQIQRLGYGKWRAAMWATLRIFRIARFLRVRIEVDGKTFLRKTPFVFVGNNRYEMDLFSIGRRERLDSGKLSIYFLHRGGRWGVIMLLWHTVTRRVRQWRDFEEVLTHSVTIQSRRKRLAVAFDGEVEVTEMPLEYKILPLALTVIVPKEAQDDA
ncbi:MAG: diacylglycerol kinase family protein [Pyrinomonadaceae bacterium]